MTLSCSSSASDMLLMTIQSVHFHVLVVHLYHSPNKTWISMSMMKAWNYWPEPSNVALTYTVQICGNGGPPNLIVLNYVGSRWVGDLCLWEYFCKAQSLQFTNIEGCYLSYSSAKGTHYVYTNTRSCPPKLTCVLKSWIQELSNGIWHSYIDLSYTVGKLLSDTFSMPMLKFVSPQFWTMGALEYCQSLWQVSYHY